MYEAATTASGQRLIWLESGVVDKLEAMRGPARAAAT
jgi:hypothetical protein